MKIWKLTRRRLNDHEDDLFVPTVFQLSHIVPNALGLRFAHDMKRGQKFSASLPRTPVADCRHWAFEQEHFAPYKCAVPYFWVSAVILNLYIFSNVTFVLPYVLHGSISSSSCGWWCSTAGWWCSIAGRLFQFSSSSRARQCFPLASKPNNGICKSCVGFGLYN